MTHLSLLFFAIPLMCLATLSTGVYHLKRLQTPSSKLHDSIDAITSYLRDSTRTFLARHFMLVAGSIGLLVVGSVVLAVLGLHVAALPALMIWGVVWSSIIGFFAIRKCTQMSGFLLHQAVTDPEACDANTTRLGWAFTLIPLGLLTVLLSYWLAVYHVMVKLNIFGAGVRLMHRAGMTGGWTDSMWSHTGVQNMVQSEASVILLAFCFGIMIQAFLVKVTTQLMRRATDAATARIDFAHGGVDADDLRNPLSLAHHLSLYADDVWGQLSHMINTNLTVVLTATAILLAAMREHPLTSDIGMIRLPFVLMTFGLVAGSVVSLVGSRSRVRKIGWSAAIIGGLSVVAATLGVIPTDVLVQVGITLVFATILTRVNSTRKETMPMGHALLIVTLTGLWGAGLFVGSGIQASVVSGLGSIAVGVVTLVTVTLSDTASLFKSNLIRLTQSNARILRIEVAEADETIPATLPQMVIVSTCSLLFLVFAFFTLVPYWLSNLTHARIISKIGSLGEKHASLYHFGDIERLVHMKPTGGSFIIGLLLTIWFLLIIGTYLQRTGASVERRLFDEADRQLLAKVGVLEGVHLPEYHHGIEMVTSDAFRTSFFVLLATWLFTLLVLTTIGISGLVAVFIGLIFCAAVGGISTWVVPKDIVEKIKFGYLIVSLTSQAILLFATLFGVIVFSSGMGL